MRKNLSKHLPLFLLPLLLADSVLLPCCSPQGGSSYLALDGEGLGTYYHIVYCDSSGRNLAPTVDSVLAEVSHTFSIYDSTSTISQFNAAERGVKSPPLASLTVVAKQVWQSTQGAFDPTVAPLARLWGFGERKFNAVDTLEVTATLAHVGFNHVNVLGDSVLKDNPKVELTYNAIAKGYAVDEVIAALLDRGITDALVEIGGEIRAVGVSPRGDAWTIGIERPTRSELPVNDLATKISIQQGAIATSGNYRKFIHLGSHTWGHTINPHTGYPEQTNLLSATVLTSKTCAEADALATAFLVMGADAAKKFILDNQEIEALLLIKNINLPDSLERWVSPGMQARIVP